MLFIYINPFQRKSKGMISRVQKYRIKCKNAMKMIKKSS